jgi:hypothetical protein
MTDTDKSHVSYRSHLLAMTMRAPRSPFLPIRRIVRVFPVSDTWKDFVVSVASGQVLDSAGNIVFSMRMLAQVLRARDALRSRVSARSASAGASS